MKDERSKANEEISASMIERLTGEVSSLPIASAGNGQTADPIAFVDANKNLALDILHDIEYEEMRLMILEEGKRLDGRGVRDIRPITCEIGLLPRTHGSALFQRGETQSLTTATLGTKMDEQMIDGLLPESTKRFMLHYNFPPFSVGEVGRLG